MPIRYTHKQEEIRDNFVLMAQDVFKETKYNYYDRDTLRQKFSEKIFEKPSFQKLAEKHQAYIRGESLFHVKHYLTLTLCNLT